MIRLRQVKFLCWGIALVAIVATTDCRWPVSPDYVRVDPAPGNALTYDAATRIVTSGSGRPSFVLDTPFQSLTNVVLDITAVDRTILPNYDMVDLGRRGGTLLRPVPNGDPSRKSRELVWQFREPIDGRVTVYPVESSTFRINGIYVRGRLLQIPLLPILFVLVVVFLGARWHLSKRERGSAPGDVTR